MHAVTHVRHIGLVSPTPGESIEFYERVWRLGKVAERDGVTHFRGSAPESFILAIHPGDRRAIHHIGMGLPSRQAVDETFEQLSRGGVPIVRRPASLDEPGGGYGFRLLDPDGRCIELSADVAEADSDADLPRGGPVKIGHIVLNTPDVDRTVEFYQRALGFRIRDWREHQMAFLGCSEDHHSIALNAAPHASLNHVAYDMADIDELMRGIARVRDSGARLLWGPGRHGPGGYIFGYFAEPSGYVCEYETGGLKIEDESSYQPQVWVRSPESQDRWGISGPWSPDYRAMTLGEPDPGIFATT